MKTGAMMVTLGWKRLSAVCLLACLLHGTGCMMVDSETGEWVSGSTPGPKRGDPGMESNIIGVSKFFAASPWLVFNANGTGRVDGVKFNVYLEGPHGPKGVFGNGEIIVDMYRIETEPDGDEVARPIFQWVYDSRKAYPWRCKRETSLGWGYGMRLQWPDDLDVHGRQVAFVVRYKRVDGQIVSSSRQILRVPVAGKKPIKMLDAPISRPPTSTKGVDGGR